MLFFVMLCEQVTVSGYVEFVRASLPNVFEGLCDSVSSASNKLKRIRKSVDRTLRFLDEIVTFKQDCQVVNDYCHTLYVPRQIRSFDSSILTHLSPCEGPTEVCCVGCSGRR